MLRKQSLRMSPNLAGSDFWLSVPEMLELTLGLCVNIQKSVGLEQILTSLEVLR